MRGGWFPGIAVACACLTLAGCGTATEHTGTIGAPKDTAPAATTAVAPAGDLERGKKHYRENSFALAVQHFRRAAEKTPKDLEAWIGLAASYDKLRRFDLADRAYMRAIRLAGQTPEILNNQGYSYLLRGDRQRARKTLLAAQAKDPSNPYIQNNLALLDQNVREAEVVR